jgi:hypothetical protein
MNISIDFLTEIAADCACRGLKREIFESINRERRIKSLHDSRRKEARRQMKAAIPQSPGMDIHESPAMRELRDRIVTEKFRHVKSIIRNKKRDISSESIHSDFESLALYNFYRSVQLHLDEWMSGKYSYYTLNLIVNSSFNKVLRGYYKRMELEKALIDDYKCLAADYNYIKRMRGWNP